MAAGRLTIVALALTLLTGSVALADAPKDPAKMKEAKTHFLAARDLMSKGYYKDAAKEYQAALDITGDPILEFNIGQAYQKAEMWDQAVAHYQAYVDKKPDAKDHDDVVKTIDQIKAQQAAAAKPPVPDFGPGPGEGTPAKPGTGAGTPGGAGNAPLAPGEAPAGEEAAYPESKPRGMRTAAWLSVGIAAALLTTGGVLALSARSRADDMNRLASQVGQDGQPLAFDGNVKTQYDELKSEGKTLNTLSMVFFGAAGAATVAAVTLFVLDRGHHESADAQPSKAVVPPPVTLKLRPILAPTVAGMGATVIF